MILRVKDLMVSPVITSVPHKSAGHVKDIMYKNRIKAVPIVNADNEPVGIITSSDLLKTDSEGTPVKNIMTDKVFTIPQYSPVQDAARMMRKRHIHHIIVTHEQQVIGIISSFDLLKLVENKRYIEK